MTGIGYNDGEATSAAIEEIEKETSRTPKVVVFVNLLEESGQSSAAREAWASWMRSRRSAFDTTHILFRSRIIEMAISVLSMLVGGGAYKTYSNPAEFERAISDRVPGFKKLPVFDDLPARPER